eukprot:scaffold1272_cov250-Pinguiococcus_pyrenoidosus.AAC.12
MARMSRDVQASPSRRLAVAAISSGRYLGSAEARESQVGKQPLARVFDAGVEVRAAAPQAPKPRIHVDHIAHLRPRHEALDHRDPRAQLLLRFAAQGVGVRQAPEAVHDVLEGAEGLFPDLRRRRRRRLAVALSHAFAQQREQLGGTQQHIALGYSLSGLLVAGALGLQLDHQRRGAGAGVHAELLVLAQRRDAAWHVEGRFRGCKFARTA